MNIREVLDTAPINEAIQKTFLVTDNKIKRYSKIMCAISGGADSDVMLDILTRLDKDNKITYVFFDTGIEYKATKQHLDYLEQKYNISIIRQKALKPIPTCVKQYGAPFLSKYVSEMIYRLQYNDFKWEDEDYETLIKKYPTCQSALKWWCNTNPRSKTGKESRFNINRNKLLKEFIIQNPPPPISNKCCAYAKKNPANDFLSKNNFDLRITGVRKEEGGIRSTQYKNCFTSGDTHDEYRIIFWFSDEDKKIYCTHYKVEHSKCYTCYGLKRTGCVGCPYNSDFEQELFILQKYEPQLFKAANNIFGEIYNYTRLYRKFKTQ